MCVWSVQLTDIQNLLSTRIVLNLSGTQRYIKLPSAVPHNTQPPASRRRELAFVMIKCTKHFQVNSLKRGAVDKWLRKCRYQSGPYTNLSTYIFVPVICSLLMHVLLLKKIEELIEKTTTPCQLNLNRT